MMSSYFCKKLEKPYCWAPQQELFKQFEYFYEKKTKVVTCWSLHNLNKNHLELWFSPQNSFVRNISIAFQSKQLYYCIKAAMERAVAQGKHLGTVELGGEFPVKDINTGEGGLLQVCMEGVGLLFSGSKVCNKLFYSIFFQVF